MGDANQPWRRLERPDEGLRPRGWPLPGPVDRRYAQSFYDHVERNADPGDRVWLQERRVLHRARLGWHDPGPHTALQRPADEPAQPPARQAHFGSARPHRRPADRLFDRRQTSVYERYRRHRAWDSGIGHHKLSTDWRARRGDQPGYQNGVLAPRSA